MSEGVITYDSDAVQVLANILLQAPYEQPEVEKMARFLYGFATSITNA